MPSSVVYTASTAAIQPGEVAERVVEFFRAYRRDLPWRRTRDPYAIWVSEIMLQQTRVVTAIPYFERWMQRFPTVDALADAPLDDVLAAWSGLGYYRRARNLHRGAREVIARYGGQLPGSAEALRALPGVGRYTAGAVASLAYGERAPIVDGNVARVLARLYALGGDIKSASTSRTLWRLAAELVPPEAPGDFNQGLMELGATVCAPASPRCDSCPLESLCQARREGRQRELPVMPRRKRASELPLLAASAAWIERDNRVVLARRPPGGLFGGLWELPQASGDRTELATLVGRAAAVSAGPPVAHHRQTLSHRRLELAVFAAEPRGPLDRLATRLAPRYDGIAWHAIDAIEAGGIASATRAIHRLYREQAGWNQSSQPSATSRRGIKKSSKGSASSGSTRTTTRTSWGPRAAPPKDSPS